MSAAILLLGLCGGLLSGMAAGGGTILVPGLVLLFGVGQKGAQAAVLTAFLATQTAAAIGQSRQGNTRWRLAWWMVAGAAAGALAGALLALRTRPALLRELYAYYLLIVGGLGWLSKKPEPERPGNRQ